MRLARLIGGTTLLLTLAVNAYGQPQPLTKIATVIVEGAEVCSGPSPLYYATSKLHKGDTVQWISDQENSGTWLSIRPPQGSFNWVPAKHLKIHGLDATVIAKKDEKVDVRIGSGLQPPPREAPTTVSRALSLTRDATIRLLNLEGFTDSQKIQWVAFIADLPDVRFIRKSDVSFGSPADGPGMTAAGAGSSNPYAMPPVSTHTPGPADSGSYGPAPAVGAAPGTARPPTAANELYTRALQAERSGNTPEAVGLWNQLAQQVATSNYQLGVQYWNHAYYLKQSYGPPTAAPAAYANNTCSQGPPAGTRLVPTATAGQAGNPYCCQPNPCCSYYAQCQGPANPSYSAAAQPRAGTWSVAGSPPPPAINVPSQATVEPPQIASRGPGFLRPTRMKTPDQKNIYALDVGAGMPPVYATATPVVSLGSYVNRKVTLNGPVAYNGEMRAELMSVNQVAPAP